jgi:hypothetical protein
MPVAATLRFMAQLTGQVDGDVTVVLRGPRAPAVGRAVLEIAGRPPHRRAGDAARSLEERYRIPAAIAGDRYPRLVGSAGAATVLESDVGDVLLRWSHVAGDGFAVQELVLAACDRVGAVPAGSWCDCAGWLAPDRREGPASIAEAGRVLLRGDGAWRALWPATKAALAPMFRRRPADERPPRAPRRGAAPGPDHVVIAELPDLPPYTGGASVFSRRCVQVVDWLAGAGLIRAGRRAITVGVAFDLRRHEPALAAAPAGNLSVVGFLTAARDGGTTDLDSLDTALRRLLRSRFWLHLAAVDVVMSALPAAVVTRINRAALGAPAPNAISVTQAWSDSSRPCRACGLPHRPMPDDLDAVIIPSVASGGGTIAALSTRRGTTLVAVRFPALGPDGAEAVLRAPGTWQEPAPKVVAAGPTLMATDVARTVRSRS